MAKKRTVAHGMAAHQGTKWQPTLASPFRILEALAAMKAASSGGRVYVLFSNFYKNS